jgi:hypothetical protein
MELGIPLALLMGLLLAFPDGRKAVLKGLQRVLRRLVRGPSNKGIIFSIWWWLIITVLALTLIPAALSLLVVTAPIWLWAFLPVLTIPLVKRAVLRRTRRRQTPTRRLPRRRRFRR